MHFPGNGLGIDWRLDLPLRLAGRSRFFAPFEYPLFAGLRFAGDPDDIVKMTTAQKGAMQFEDSLGVCRFNTRTEMDQLCQEICDGSIQTMDQLSERLESARDFCRRSFPQQLVLFENIYVSRSLWIWDNFGAGRRDSGPYHSGKARPV